VSIVVPNLDNRNHAGPDLFLLDVQTHGFSARDLGGNGRAVLPG